MATSIVVAVSLLFLVWVEILKKNWLHQDQNILTSGNKRDHVIRGCLSLDWEFFQARVEEPAYWKFASGHTSCCWKGLSTVVFCTSSQAMPSKWKKVLFPFYFTTAGLPILWLSKTWMYIHAMVALILFRWCRSHWKLPAVWMCPSFPSILAASVCTICA